MPAKHDLEDLPVRAWFPLSNGAVANCCLQYWGRHELIVQATLTNEAPANLLGAKKLTVNMVIDADTPLSSLFGGLGAGPYYLWGWTEASDAQVSMSHA